MSCHYEIPPPENLNEGIRSLVQLMTVRDFNENFTSDEDFRIFATKVYHWFDRMPVNTKLNLLAYEGRKLEWILLTFVAFYFEGPHFLEYEISDDYTAIIRRYSDPVLLEHCIKAWRTWKYERKEEDSTVDI